MTFDKPPSALRLLLQVNGLSAWRRLKAVRQQSRLLTAVIFLFILTYLAAAYWLFFSGLKFVARFPGLGGLLVERLIFLLFAFLFMLLFLSNLVISYTNLFRNRETTFLLSLPISTRTIFQWKFIESTLLASWAFVFLIAPLLAAYGLTQGVAWHFYLVTMIEVALFIILPAVAGSFMAVTVARFLDRRLFQVLTLTTLVALIGAAIWWFRPEPIPEDISETRVLAVLDKMLLKTRFAHYPLLPSSWLSRSILEWAEGALSAAGFFLLVLLSYVLFLGTLALNFMGGLFYEANSTVQSRGSVFARWGWRGRAAQRARATFGAAWGERLLSRLVWVDADVRALMIKDARMFWRDTTQWAQSLMLFGLLGVYIVNLRHFSQQLVNPFWVHLVSFLNLGACSLNLATLTTRFVFPQFSLEGKRLWIVGMAPLGMTRVLKTKFWMAACGSLVVTLGLILLSCYMLQLSVEMMAYFAVAIVIMTFTLNGLAVGLGALYPNFKEDNPSKIVSGFGGTFCLVLSFFYILVSVILLGLATPRSALMGASFWQPLGCGLAFLGISVVLGYLPLRLGLRRVTAEAS